jgi:hypothetical protein
MKNLLISLLILSSWHVLSQEREDNSFKSDISLSGGITSSENSFGRFGIIYRKPINNSLKFKVSGYYSKFYSHNSLNDFTVYSSDSLIILRNREVHNRNFTVKFGVDKTLYNFVNIGVDINLGYSNEQLITRDKGIAFNPLTNQWETCSTCVYEYHGQEVNNDPVNPGLPNYVRSNNGKDYLIYGFSLNAGLYHPIGDRWELAFQYSPDVMMFQSLDGSGYMFNKIFHFADIMLRFKI